MGLNNVPTEGVQFSLSNAAAQEDASKQRL
jgi:hypothetical protein